MSNKTEAIPHKWVYDTNNGSYDLKSYKMSYYHEKLYSYGSILATIDREKQIVLVDSHVSNYSNTSSRHAYYMRNAIPSWYKVFECRESYDFPTMEGYYKAVIDLVDKQSRARKRDYTYQITKYINEAVDFATIFKHKRSKEYKYLYSLQGLNIAQMLGVTSDIIEANKKRKLRAKKKREKLMQESRQDELDRFTGGGIKFDPNYSGVYLKIEDDKLKTTNSITVPLNEALILYSRYINGKDIVGTKFDYYTVVSATKNQVKIGCTVISRIELDRVLGVA